MLTARVFWWRPRRPVGAVSQLISGSNQPLGTFLRKYPAGQGIVSEPRRLSASLQAGQFLVLWVGDVGLLMHPRCRTGLMR